MTSLLLVRPPGVYRAENDTRLVADLMSRGGYAEGRDVLDLCTGTGALAVVAHRAGARSVTAVDLSRRSVAAAWINGRVHRAPVTVRRGDLFAPVAGRRFGLVVVNPPYVPAATGVLPRHTVGRCWDGGVDGRAVLDRICAGVADALEPDGTVLIVQSALSGVRGHAGRPGARRARRSGADERTDPVRPGAAPPRRAAHPARRDPGRRDGRGDRRDRGPPCRMSAGRLRPRAGCS